MLASPITFIWKRLKWPNRQTKRINGPKNLFASLKEKIIKENLSTIFSLFFLTLDKKNKIFSFIKITHHILSFSKIKRQKIKSFVIFSKIKKSKFLFLLRKVWDCLSKWVFPYYRICIACFSAKLFSKRDWTILTLKRRFKT